MASLPSVAVGSTVPKLEPEVCRKLPPSSLPLDMSLSHQRSPSSTPERSSEIFQSLDFREALAILKGGNRVESALYVPLLQQCVDRKSLRETQILHAHIVKTGTHEDLFTSTSLVNVYAKCGTMQHARKLFDKLPRRNIVTWTALITGYTRNSEPEQAIRVFIRLLESGVYPTNYTLGAILSACCSLYCIRLGRQVHGYIIKYGIESDTSVGNSLSSFYSKCRSLEAAVDVFRKIPDKNVISWTTIVSACSDNGEAEMGLRLFVDMLLEGTKPNDFTLTSALSLCCAAQALGLGKQIQSSCVKFGCESQLPVRNSIMYLYLKCGDIDVARRLFDDTETTVVSLITWNAMIAGHAQMMDSARDDVSAHCSGTEALKIFLKLNRSEMKPDLFSFSSILTVCSGLAALEQGEQIHAQTIKTGFLSDVVVGSALVNMYNKCGSIERASKAFVEMPTRTMISWTSMVAAYSQHGRSKEALQLFQDMRLAGVRPNQVTFVGVLSACSQAGMVEEARYYFKMMKDEYRIKPVMDHYACMVDMYVRLGRLAEAFDFVGGTPFEPNEVVWSILIAGCRSHGKMELGFYAADRLLELKRIGRTETYSLLLNMYISAERWQDVSRVRKLMKEEKVESVKDWSWISVKDKVYSFRADDRSHSQSVEIYGRLESLLEKARDLQLGYDVQSHKSSFLEEEEIPSSSSEEEEDEEGKKSGRPVVAVVHHSERLAIAFGLMHTPEGAPVRVVKNTSMCRDCHSCVKFFSVVTQREIIVRDSKRLHRFRGGQCSCGDFGAFLL